MNANPIFIYGVFQGKVCLYVGQSKDPDSRFRNHRKDFRKCGIESTMKIFRKAPPAQCMRIEAQIIQAFWKREQAKWNTTCKPKEKYRNPVLKWKNKERLSRQQWRFLGAEKKLCQRLPSVNELQSAAREFLQERQKENPKLAYTLLATTLQMSDTYQPEIVSTEPLLVWFPWVGPSPSLGFKITHFEVVATKPGAILLK